MIDTIDQLAADLDAAIQTPAKSGCSCCDEQAEMFADSDVTLPAAVPSAAEMAVELDAALEDEFLGGEPDAFSDFPELDELGGSGSEAITLEQVLEFLRANPGLKVSLSF